MKFAALAYVSHAAADVAIADDDVAIADAAATIYKYNQT